LFGGRRKSAGDTEALVYEARSFIFLRGLPGQSTMAAISCPSATRTVSRDAALRGPCWPPDRLRLTCSLVRRTI